MILYIYGENFWTVYTAFYNVSPVMAESVVTEVTGLLQNILADIAMVCILQLASAIMT